MFIRGKVGKVGNVLLATGEGDGTARDSLHRSVDNGQTWVEAFRLSELGPGAGFGFPAVSDDRAFVNAGLSDRIFTTADAGVSWDELVIPTTSSQGLGNVFIGNSERLIVPQSTFSPNIWLSDDNGASWEVRPSPLQFSDTIRRGLSVGGGRILYLANTGIGSFGPKRLASNNNGSSWQLEDPFQVIDELERVFNDPDQRVIDLQRIFQSERGTLVILAEQGELLVSRDLGRSWEVKLFLERLEEAFLDWTISEVMESDGRLIAIASRNSPTSSAFRLNFAYISEDEGDTWRPVPIPTSESRVAFQSGVVGGDGRLVISGNNGAVYISDPIQIYEDNIENFRVREAESLTIDVPPPPVPGDLNVTYRLLSGSATGGNDFVQNSDQLNWADGDNAPQQITVETIDDSFNEGDESLRIELSLSGELIYSWSYEVTIADDELMFALTTNVDIELDGAIRTNEDGSNAEFGVALSRRPSENVTLELSLDATGEVTFLPTSLTFTPDNWKRVRPVTVTGVDDEQLDGNRTVQLIFTTASAGPEYNNLEPGIAYIINEDNDLPEMVFSSGFEDL